MAAKLEPTLARIKISSDSRDKVLHEGALQGERVVAFIRLALFLARGLAFTVLYGGQERDPVRGKIILGYAIFCFAVVGLLYVKRLAGRRFSLYAPFVFTGVDCAFLVAMGMRSIDTEHVSLAESAATNLALVLCFTIARFSRAQVVFAAVLTCASYLFIAAYGGGVDKVQAVVVLAGLSSLAVLIAWANARISRMFLDFKRREVLAGFLPRQVVERAMSLDGTLLDPVQRDVTLLFTDIRDFTKLSEHMPPRELLQFLDGYFERISRVVQGHDGVVNKFLGDGMLAVWGAPDPTDRHAELAVRAALDIRKQMVEFNEERTSRGLSPIKMGMGIHTGPVAAGMMGGARQHEYTVIGDSVNLASRIESLTKGHGLDLLVSDSTWQIVKERFNGTRVAEEHVKGRAQPVVVYTVAGPAVPEQEKVIVEPLGFFASRKG